MVIWYVAVPSDGVLELTKTPAKALTSFPSCIGDARVPPSASRRRTMLPGSGVGVGVGGTGVAEGVRVDVGGTAVDVRVRVAVGGTGVSVGVCVGGGGVSV